MAGLSQSLRSRQTPPNDASPSSSNAHPNRRHDPRHRMSASTLADSMTAPSNTHNPPPSAAAAARAGSNPASLRSLDKRPRRAAGGFLLGTGSRKSSLERSSLDQERDLGILHQPSFHSGASTAVAGRDDGSTEGFGEQADDVDPARMVSLILGESEKRKTEAQTTNKRPRAGSSEKSAISPQTRPSSLKPKDAAGRGRAVSPTRSFLMPGRSPSTSSPNRKRVSSFTTSSPPPAPSRPTFPTPSMPSFTTSTHEKKRRSLGLKELKELQNDHKFTEATLQRTLKAKQLLGLSHLYRQLIDLHPHSSSAGTLQSALGDRGKTQHGYNPLQVIRNRKMRNRKKIHLDAAPWEDPGLVEQWIEDFAVSIYSPGPDGSLPAPPEPQSPSTKIKRPRMDWMITPQEMLADYYWVESENIKEQALDREREFKRARRLRQSIERERYRDTATPIQTHMLTENESSADEANRKSWDSPRRKRTTAGAAEYHRALQRKPQLPEFGYGSSTSSASTDTSDSDSSLGSSDSDIEMDSDGNVLKKKKDKHHRRRRKIKHAITGGRHGKKRKDKEVDLDEHRRKHDMEEMDWMTSEKSVTSEKRPGLSTDEEYDFGPSKLQKTSTGLSVPTHASGSRSSLERFTTNTGYGLPGDKFQDHIFPSIAINLSPPREKSPTDADDEDRGGKSPNKLLGRSKEHFHVKSREVGLDESGRESVELDRPKKKEKDDKVRGMKRVKTKLRHEVSKVEDRIWKRDNGSALPSPSASSFSDSVDMRTDEDGHFRLSREDTLSASDEDGVPKGRQSLEVPKVTRPSRHRSHYSTSYIPTLPPNMLSPRQSLSTGRDNGEARRRGLETPMVSVTRDPSPIRGVVIESVHRKRAREAEANSPRRKDPGTISPTILKRTQVPSAQRIMVRRPTFIQAEAGKFPLAATKKEIARARAQFVACGVVARGCVGSHNRPSDLAVARKQNRSMEAAVAGIDEATRMFGVRTAMFTTSTVPKLRKQVDKVHMRLATVVAPRIREVADNADALSSKVTTDWTMQAKTVGDEVQAILRRRKRRLRWVRRSGYVLLEWTLVWVMWLVWLIVMVLKVFKGIFKGVVTGVRWILWI